MRVKHDFFVNVEKVKTLSCISQCRPTRITSCRYVADGFAFVTIYLQVNMVRATESVAFRLITRG